MKYRKVKLLLEQKQEGHKEYKYLYHKMLDKDIIFRAYKKLRKGKTKRKEIEYIDAHYKEEAKKIRDIPGDGYTLDDGNNGEYDVLGKKYAAKVMEIYEKYGRKNR